MAPTSALLSKVRQMATRRHRPRRWGPFQRRRPPRPIRPLAQRHLATSRRPSLPTARQSPRLPSLSLHLLLRPTSTRPQQSALHSSRRRRLSRRLGFSKPRPCRRSAPVRPLELRHKAPPSRSPRSSVRRLGPMPTLNLGRRSSNRNNQSHNLNGRASMRSEAFSSGRRSWRS